jgi:hypothetical protein
MPNSFACAIILSSSAFIADCISSSGSCSIDSSAVVAILFARGGGQTFIVAIATEQKSKKLPQFYFPKATA